MGCPLDKWEERMGCMGTSRVLPSVPRATQWRPGLGPGGRHIQSVTVNKSLNSTLPCFPSAEWV